MSGVGRMYVVSPHLLVAQAVAAALDSVGTPAEARQWDSLVAQGPRTAAHAPRPDLVVAVTDGVDNSAVIGHVEDLLDGNEVRVLVITSEEGAVCWGGLLDRDAFDVLALTTSVTDLARAAATLAAGGTVMDPEHRRALRVAWALTIDRRRELEVRLASLSPQQHRVLELLASGRRVTEVGGELGVSSGTVRSHVKSLRAKLGVRTQLKAVAIYHEVHGQGARADLVPRPRQGSGDVGSAVRGVELPESVADVRHVGPSPRR